VRANEFSDLGSECIIGKTPKGYGYFVNAGTPSVKWTRFPFGRRPYSPLTWTATSAQCLHELAEERAQASRLRYGHEETAKTDHARAKWVPGIPYARVSVETHLAVNRAASIRKNARMGWKPDGSEIVA